MGMLFCPYTSSSATPGTTGISPNLVWKERGLDIAVGIASRYGLDRGGDRIPVGTRVSATVQTGPGPNQPPVQWVPGLFPGVNAAGAGRVELNA